MMRTLLSQRERARREAEAAAAEAGRLREQLRSTQSKGRQLHSDNLALYEKTYGREYEATISPFSAFQRRERAARLAELSPPEKLLLAVSSLLLSHRRARRGLLEAATT
ncbi:hypothetical protein EMIHUDRAFT_450884 [Emiliania huxleyi CCMP1516]|uniref:CASP C-terminal domain-containing protein n=2 Tax=Emiliania huxleyi TaxID=2903 RepID=A0A0D3JBW3_EMIH1|nr:hypothetical protein EMIHUDRAFT_450884 [Emiliania huxleyi CCMP1516]EOD20998.1 hypothetical protein EMIHUDRAFT_450884 [Emiliania huxleyi CCMP1516]|eukprot:XP_005773427.1 hypothetical protein EMIHUDRAFT_450884 [Emiliania huxleyi CCMP1516]